MRTRVRIITLLAAFGILAGWTAAPPTCSAQGYCYQAPPVQVYNYSLLPYPSYQAYSLPAPVPVGYAAVYPATPPYKIKHKHKYKHKHKHKNKHKYYNEYY